MNQTTKQREKQRGRFRDGDQFAFAYHFGMDAQHGTDRAAKEFFERDFHAVEIGNLGSQARTPITGGLTLLIFGGRDAGCLESDPPMFGRGVQKRIETQNGSLPRGPIHPEASRIGGVQRPRIANVGNRDTWNRPLRGDDVIQPDVMIELCHDALRGGNRAIRSAVEAGVVRTPIVEDDGRGRTGKSQEARGEGVEKKACAFYVANFRHGDSSKAVDRLADKKSRPQAHV